jgi:hypothetical protein
MLVLLGMFVVGVMLVRWPNTAAGFIRSLPPVSPLARAYIGHRLYPMSLFITGAAMAAGGGGFALAILALWLLQPWLTAAP